MNVLIIENCCPCQNNDHIMWVTLSYSLTNMSLMLILGKVSDLVGRKR